MASGTVREKIALKYITNVTITSSAYGFASLPRSLTQANAIVLAVYPPSNNNLHIVFPRRSVDGTSWSCLIKNGDATAIEGNLTINNVTVVYQELQ